MAEFVAVKGLCKRYGDAWAVEDVSFEVEEGELLVLLGPSGCGKTTTLRCVGGLEQPDKGEIVIDGEEVTNVSKGLYLQPEVRGMGMVAQSYAIWPHMSVFENVAFPLRMRREGSPVISERVREALDVVRLGEFGDRNATDLSGGQQQRVALARAIVARPKVLLFDEPLSNLDAKLREDMRYLIKDIQREIKITAIYVTHDQAEAMALGDELLVMNAGKIEQRGDARSVYCEPKTQFVAGFIGTANLIEGTVVGELPGNCNAVQVRIGEEGINACDLRIVGQNADLGNSVAVVVRPEWVKIHRKKPDVDQNVISGIVHKSQYLGDRTEVLISTDYAQMRVWIDGTATIENGKKIHLEIDGEKCIALPSN